MGTHAFELRLMRSRKVPGGCGWCCGCRLSWTSSKVRKHPSLDSRIGKLATVVVSDNRLRLYGAVTRIHEKSARETAKPANTPTSASPTDKDT